MNRAHPRIAFLCTGLAVLLSQSAWAQSINPASEPAPAAAEEIVELPQFVITETPANPYQSGQALSTSRVAMLIQDIPQTVSVVTQEFIKDTMSFRMLDAAKYVTPIVESTLPYGGDRYMIRGFQVSQEFIDGTSISGGSGYSMSIPQYNIERIESSRVRTQSSSPVAAPAG
jgi:iron complex outermembrane receptor protein